MKNELILFSRINQDLSFDKITKIPITTDSMLSKTGRYIKRVYNIPTGSNYKLDNITRRQDGSVSFSILHKSKSGTLYRSMINYDNCEKAKEDGWITT